MDKDKITLAINELSSERLEKLKEIAESQLSEYQKNSYMHDSFLDLAMRKVMSRYIK